MKYDKKIIRLGILSGVVFVLTGCMEMRRPAEAAPKPAAESGQKTEAAALNRFQSTTPEGPTAAESAIDLSKKYAALSEEMSKYRLEKQTLVTENAQLKEQIAAMEPESAKIKKELAEANDLLVEMRIELNNWKTDVLGFRDEMRQADKAQIETLIKILEILGGEAKAALPEPEPAADAAAAQ